MKYNSLLIFKSGGLEFIAELLKFSVEYCRGKGIENPIIRNLPDGGYEICYAADEEPAGDCTFCGGQVYRRPGKPGEFDHQCAGAPRVAAVRLHPVVVLFARKYSIYKTLQGVDCYDKQRDAKTWSGGFPVVAHPPCRSWGRLSHMAKPEAGEQELGIWAVEQVRRWGGVLEHPAASRLWSACGLPKPDYGTDEYGGWTLDVKQSWWGHPCTKPTWLYVCGCSPADLPQCVVTPRNGTHAICRDRRPGIKSRNAQKPEISHGDRDMTPRPLAVWLVELARKCRIEPNTKPIGAPTCGRRNKTLSSPA